MTGRAEALRSPDPSLRVRALNELSGELSAEETDALIECLADGRKIVQRTAAETVARLLDREERLRAELERALAGGPWGLRWGVVFALSLSGGVGQDALDTLLEALSVDDGDVRWAAAELIVRLAAGARDRVVEGLLERLERGSPNQVKMALYCLRDLDVREPAAIEAVERALGAALPDVRLAAVSALARLADPHQAALRIAALLDTADERIQRSAAATLARLDDRSPEVIVALERAARSDDPSLRKAAGAALDRLRAVG